MVYCFADNCFIDNDGFYVLTGFKSMQEVVDNIAELLVILATLKTLILLEWVSEPILIDILDHSLISHEIYGI